jgi:hypothetical protein
MRFAFILPWPDQLSAEKEFSERLKQVMRKLKHDLVIASEAEIDLTEVHLRTQKFGDYLLIPHFTITPKEGFVNLQLLWNSPKTMSEYRYGLTNVISSQILVSGGSKLTDEFLEEFSGKSPICEIYPTLLDPHLESQVRKGSKMFYSGINWERITGNPSRHSEILMRLDRANLIEIYGPKKLRGIDVWKGFINYQGEIEADGSEILSVANKYGVTLALLNEQHVRWGFPSIRLAEAFAAKNVVITSDYAYLDFLGDSIFRIPNDASLELQVKFIGETLNWIWSNPEAAKLKADDASSRWFQKYSLDDQVTTLVNSLQAQKEKQVGNIGIKVKVLDPRSSSYTQDLYLATCDNEIDLVVHSLEAEKWICEAPTLVHELAEENLYLLTNAYLKQNGVDRVHPGLESYSNAGPSYLSASALIINTRKLREIKSIIQFTSAETFFTSLLLHSKESGYMIPSISHSDLIENRITVTVSISQQYNLVAPGKIYGLRVATINHETPSLFLNKVRVIAVRYMPKKLRDLIRPIFVRYFR